MAGELVPLVMFPRFTTLAGVFDPGDGILGFKTIGMDVTNYESVSLNVWLGTLQGTGGTVKLWFEESTDQDSWSKCSEYPSGATLAAEAETSCSATLTKRWFRVRLELPNADNVVTCWAVGFLEERTT